MKNEKPNDTHAKNEKAMPLGDDMLKDVAGGNGAAPRRAFYEGARVGVKMVLASGNTKVYYGVIGDCYFDDDLNTWTYQVIVGTWEGSRFVESPVEIFPDYVPQSQIFLQV